MTRHLRALSLPLVAGCLAVVVLALAGLAARGPQIVEISPGLLTSAAPALVAVIAALVLRCPLGELAGTTARSGQQGAWLASLGL